MSDGFKNFYKNKFTWFFEHILFAGIPVHFAVVEFASRPSLHYLLLALVALYTLCIALLLFKNKLSALGLGLNNTLKSTKAILPSTIVLGLLVFFGKHSGIIAPAYFHGMSTVLLYAFISVPLQELVFRSLCWWRCSISWKNNWFIILFTSTNFAFYHIFLGGWQLIIGVFLLNLYWSYYYQKQHNIFSTAISHALIGIIYFL